MAKISEIYDELSLSTKGETEFTVNNVKLPEYESEAVQLFFGSQDQSQETPIKDLQHFNQMFTDKLNEILGTIFKLI
jgi:hypothetical protein